MPALHALVSFGGGVLDGTATPAAIAVAVSLPQATASASEANFPLSAAEVGTTVGSPGSSGTIDLTNDSIVLSETVITGNVFCRWGASITLTNCEIIGSVVVQPRDGQTPPVLIMDSCSVSAGMSVNPLDSTGSFLYWDTPLDVTMDINRCWIYHPVAFQPDHVEALAGFGQPSGARFTSTSFIQQGAPGFADGVTGVANWYAHDSLFDDCLFGWEDGPAAPYCLYMRPEAAGGHTAGGTTIQNCALMSGSGQYIYPGNAGEGYAHALYVDCYDFDTSDPLTLPD